mgnify:CR=1 FL=1
MVFPFMAMSMEMNMAMSMEMNMVMKKSMKSMVRKEFFPLLILRLFPSEVHTMSMEVLLIKLTLHTEIQITL